MNVFPFLIAPHNMVPVKRERVIEWKLLSVK